MAFDTRAGQGLTDKSITTGAAEEIGDGCKCPYCGRTIPSEELEAQGYAATEAGGAMGQEGASDRDVTPGADIDDTGLISKFNASRPGPLQADAGKAAGLLSAARRMVRNKDY